VVAFTESGERLVGQLAGGWVVRVDVEGDQLVVVHEMLRPERAGVQA
jgi:hypothetical protein